jgi:hypothetical protein
MKNTYQGVRVFGPLASHADRFYSWLIDRRFYSPLTAVDHLRLMAAACTPAWPMAPSATPGLLSRR